MEHQQIAVAQRGHDCNKRVEPVLQKGAMLQQQLLVDIQTI